MFWDQILKTVEMEILSEVVLNCLLSFSNFVISQAKTSAIILFALTVDFLSEFQAELNRPKIQI